MLLGGSGRAGAGLRSDPGRDGAARLGPPCDGGAGAGAAVRSAGGLAVMDRERLLDRALVTILDRPGAAEPAGGGTTSEEADGASDDDADDGGATTPSVRPGYLCRLLSA